MDSILSSLSSREGLLVPHCPDAFMPADCTVTDRQTGKDPDTRQQLIAVTKVYWGSLCLGFNSCCQHKGQWYYHWATRWWRIQSQWGGVIEALMTTLTLCVSVSFLHSRETADYDIKILIIYQFFKKLIWALSHISLAKSGEVPKYQWYIQ